VGYDQGGQPTGAVRRRPYQVILFDEIEKAHDDVWNALLQILEEGRLTDGHGRVVDFRNTVIVMTSNIGTPLASRRSGALGFHLGGETDEERQFVSDITDSLKRTFRPEFLNRIDEIIVFKRLTRDDVMAIADIQMRDLEARLREQCISLHVTEAAKGWLADKGYDPSFGARPLRRTIQRFVESPLSQRLLEGTFGAGQLVSVDLDAGASELVFKAQDDAEGQGERFCEVTSDAAQVIDGVGEFSPDNGEDAAA